MEGDWKSFSGIMAQARGRLPRKLKFEATKLNLAIPTCDSMDHAQWIDRIG